MGTELTMQDVVASTGTERRHPALLRTGRALLPPVDRGTNGHRRYGPQHLESLQFLNCLRAAGMSIADMRRFVDMQRAGAGTAIDRPRCCGGTGPKWRRGSPRCRTTWR
jgi:hypothetical protein